MAALLLIPILIAFVALLFSLFIGLLAVGFWVFVVLFAVWAFVFWIWMLIDCLRNENITGNEKVAWVLAIALTHWVGALIYYFAGRPRTSHLSAA
jgi:Phospholipase_D-nuclease N-terminal